MERSPAVSVAEPQPHTRLGPSTAPMGLSYQGIGQRVRTELRDSLELVAVPGLAAILPWRWCFAIFKRLARVKWLYQEQCEAALQMARARGWSGEDEAHWLWRRRMVTIIDHADHYLGLWRKDSWMEKYLDVQGHWPDPKTGAILLSFHWGAGFWGLRHAASKGLHPHALVASLNSDAFKGRAVMSWYARSRNAQVASVLGADTIDVSKRLNRLIWLLKNKQSVLAVVDVPSPESQSSVLVTLLGMRARVPKGLFRLAISQQKPLAIYATGINLENGRRFLRIKPIDTNKHLNVLTDATFWELEQLIAEDAPAWHFWAIANQIFTDGPT